MCIEALCVCVCICKSIKGKSPRNVDRRQISLTYLSPPPRIPSQSPRTAPLKSHVKRIEPKRDTCRCRMTCTYSSDRFTAEVFNEFNPRKSNYYRLRCFHTAWHHVTHDTRHIKGLLWGNHRAVLFGLFFTHFGVMTKPLHLSFANAFSHIFHLYLSIIDNNYLFHRFVVARRTRK